MIDTIGLRILKSKKEVISQMGKNKIKKKSNGDKLIFTQKQLHIEGVNNMTFISVSLTKFIRGDNLYNVSFKKLSRAIKILIQLINIPPEEILLYRVDYASNFIMKHPVSFYTKGFAQLEHYERDTFMNNRNCQYIDRRNIRTILLYDKVEEMRKKHKSVPTNLLRYKDRILRLEVRINRRIKSVINYKPGNITILDLLDKNFLELLLKNWFNSYKLIASTRIDKIKLQPSSNTITTASQLEKHLAYIGMRTLGFDKIRSFITHEVISAPTRKRMKDSISKLKLHKYSVEDYNIKAEHLKLDEKVKRIYKMKQEEIRAL
jgi:hypothetical protein